MTATAQDIDKQDVDNGYKGNLLLVDDDENLLRLMSIRLISEGYSVTSANHPEEALKFLFSHDYNAVVTDLRMPGMDGLALVDEIVHRHPKLPVIMMTAHGSIKEAISATERGVFGFLPKPVNQDELQVLLEKAIGQTAEASFADWTKQIITRSTSMISVLKQAKQIADKNVSVLITGASGTGKELLAKAIHDASDRANKPFIPINCGALPENLLESELFGHAKGAFTGAVKSNIGLFREAEGGTLFLDEIGDMPLALQVKLLRVLQERIVRPVGSTSSYDVDVRVISATHQNLQTSMQDKEFREDLFYRLNVVNLELPRLKDRFEDVPLLADHLMRLSAKKHGISVRRFSGDAMAILSKADWPGNVRQLVNVVERCVALTTSKVIPASLVEQALSLESSYWPTLTQARDNFEHNYLSRLLQLTEGNVTKASEMAGRNRTDLHKLMKKHGLTANDFRH
ncbi:MAG: sigma 54-interacting transcriptional regulator [Pseudomonadota bacterium]